jgi:N-acetylglucosamine-6-phosphate deacetylase
MMICQGRDVSTGEQIVVEGDAVIAHVNPAFGGGDDSVWIAPGFIDLQVNGFAGADFNSSSTKHTAIADALRAMFSTGVTRCFPTVITGSPQRMLATLRNLARAKETLEDGAAMEARISLPTTGPAARILPSGCALLVLRNTRLGRAPLVAT